MTKITEMRRLLKDITVINYVCTDKLDKLEEMKKS